jgi:hypothetical protein
MISLLFNYTGSHIKNQFSSFASLREATMTEPLNGISSTREVTEKNKREKSRLQRGNLAGHQDGVEDDSVDISDEARDKAAGRNRRNILDYINDDTA